MDAIGTLARALHREKDPAERAVAAEELGRLGRKHVETTNWTVARRAAEVLISALEDEDVAVRVAAAEALGKIGDSRSVSSMLGALHRADDKRTRLAITQALWQIGDVQAVEHFLEALQEKDVHVRVAAAGVLGKIGDVSRTSSIFYAARQPNASKGPLVTHAAQLVTSLISVLGQPDEDEAVLVTASRALGKTRKTQAITPLVALLRRDERDKVRVAVARALRHIRDERSVAALIAALDDSSSDVRAAAVTSLGEIGDAEVAVESLTGALADPEWRVRYCVAEALGRIGDAQAVPALISALGDPNRYVRLKAALALKHLMPQPEAALQDQLEEIFRAPTSPVHEQSKAWVAQGAKYMDHKATYCSECGALLEKLNQVGTAAFDEQVGAGISHDVFLFECQGCGQCYVDRQTLAYTG